MDPTEFPNPFYDPSVRDRFSANVLKNAYISDSQPHADPKDDLFESQDENLDWSFHQKNHPNDFGWDLFLTTRTGEEFKFSDDQEKRLHELISEVIEENERNYN